MCDPLVVYIDVAIGQSNQRGSDDVNGVPYDPMNPPEGDFPDNPEVFVWDANYDTVGTSLAPLSPALRGTTPFSEWGSNTLSIHAADLLQKRSGARSALLLQAKGGAPITDFLPGGEIWEGLLTNMGGLLATCPNAKLRSLMIHEGESAQLNELDWFFDKLKLLASNFRAQSWFPAETPIVFGQLYCGPRSSANHWRQNFTLERFARSDPFVSLVSSEDLDVIDEGFTDTSGAPYGVHFRGNHLTVFGKRYGAEIWNMMQGGKNVAPFNMRQRFGCREPDRLIKVEDGHTLNLTIQDLLSSPTIKCMGSADINLPDIMDNSMSSWVRNLEYNLRVFANSVGDTVRLVAGGSGTLAFNNLNPVSSLEFTNDRSMRFLCYTKDNRWRVR